MFKHKQPNRWILTLLFSGIVFIIIAVTMLFMGWIIYFLNHFNLLNYAPNETPLFGLIIFVIASIVIGTIIATVFSRIPLKPVNKLMDGMSELSNGNFNTTIDLGRNPLAKELSHSFNILSKELSQTEVLRTDFVNNLSHEYKTPIVSILGFAKLLQRSELSEEQQEFVDIIVTESARLTNMTTNMLALTKIENQHILTDITRFNLSEQLRQSIILLEEHWGEKDLMIEADFPEVMITANEELLKQIWINLMDNGIKYAPKESILSFTIDETTDSIQVSIKNTGPKIDPDIQNRIFNKYWQEDISHASEGTGIGLSISKKIAELHHGNITVDSDDKSTRFIVTLPK